MELPTKRLLYGRHSAVAETSGGGSAFVGADVAGRQTHRARTPSCEPRHAEHQSATCSLQGPVVLTIL